jgi:hypothetical protein
MEPARTDIDYSRIYSSTKLAMFRQCPKQYHFYYLDPVLSKLKNKLKNEPENIFSFYTLGKAVHNAITVFYHKSVEERTLAKLREVLKGTWRSEAMWRKDPPLGKWGGYATIEEERASYREALEMLGKFFASAEIDPPIAYLPTEDFMHSIGDYQALIQPLDAQSDISGKFDLIVKEGRAALQVIDFKTSKREQTDQSQLRFYKLLAELNFKKPVTKATLVYLRSGQKQEAEVADLDVKEIKNDLLDQIQTIKKTEEFIPQPGKLCRYCLFIRYCPKKDEAYGIIKTAKPEEIPDDLPF